MFSRRNPEESIVFTLRGFGSNQGNIHPFVTQRHLVLFMVVDMRGILDDAKEYRNGISWQLGPYEFRKGGIVKGLSGVGTNLNRCTAGTSLVVGKADAVDVGLVDARELA